MKKTLFTLILVISISLSLFCLVGFGMKNDASIGIIGGADGPTAMMVTGSLINYLTLISGVFSIARLVGVLIVAIILYKKGI